MIWTVFVVLLILWLAGWRFVDSGLIHLVLVVAVIVLVVNLLTGRRGAS